MGFAVEKRRIDIFSRERCGIDAKTIRRLQANESVETRMPDKLRAALLFGLENIVQYIAD